MRTALLIFLAYLPWQVALSPATGVDLPTAKILAPLLVLAWLAHGLIKRRVWIPINIASVGLAIFFVLALGSLTQAEEPFWGLRKLIVLAAFFPLYFVFHNVTGPGSRTESPYKKAAQVLAISSVLVAALGLFQFLSQFVWGLDALAQWWQAHLLPIFHGLSIAEVVKENLSWYVNINGRDYLRAFGPFAEPHSYAFWLGMTMPFAATLALKTGRRVWWLTLGVMLAGFLVSFVRAGYIALIASALVFGAIIAKSHIRQPSPVTYMTAAIAGLGIFIAFAFMTGALNRFTSLFEPYEGSVVERQNMWQVAGAAIMEHPVRGVGLGNFALYVEPGAELKSPISAHNTYLEIGAEMGLFALLVWLIIIVNGIAQSFLASKSDVFLAAIAASLTYFAIHSLGETILWSERTLPFLMFALAAACSRRTLTEE